MNDWDSQLIELITDLDGHVSELREIVEDHGTTLVSRVIADRVALVFRATDDELFSRSRDRRRYLPVDEALHLIERERIPQEYRIVDSGTIDPQLDGTLMFRYTADDPAAIAEVRSKRGRE